MRGDGTLPDGELVSPVRCGTVSWRPSFSVGSPPHVSGRNATASGGMPSVGDRQVVVDSDGRRVCVIEHTDIDLVPLKDITDEPVVVCQYFHVIGTYTGSHTINQRRSRHI